MTQFAEERLKEVRGFSHDQHFDLKQYNKTLEKIVDHENVEDSIDACCAIRLFFDERMKDLCEDKKLKGEDDLTYYRHLDNAIHDMNVISDYKNLILIMSRANAMLNEQN